VGDQAKPGIMQAITTQNTTGSSRSDSLVALNVDPAACDPQRNDPARLAAWINQTVTVPASAVTTISSAQSSTSASVWLLVSAALVILAETLLGRTFSVPEPKTT